MSSPEASSERPLSPHLQIYRWQITNTLSILHRLTGIALSAGTLLLVYWLIAVATGPGRFAYAQALIMSWPGQLLMLGWTFSLFYHLGNGIRHLSWDAGWGFELKTLRATGWLVVLFSLIMTGVCWWLAGAIPGIAP